MSIVINVSGFLRLRNLIATLALIVIVWPSSAQDYGRIDTLQIWRDGHYVSFVQAFYDTLIVRIEDANSTNDFFNISYDGGWSWQFLTDKTGVVHYMPGIGSYVTGFDFLSKVNRDTLQEFWLIRGGKFIFQDTIGAGDTVYPLPIGNMYQHPMDRNQLFYVGVIYATAGDRHFVYLSTDAGRNWKQINVPAPTEGLGFQIGMRFDYSDPTLWYIGVRGDDVFGGGRGTEWYQTTDSGRTYKARERVGFLNGLFGAGTDLQFPLLNRFDLSEGWGNPVITRAQPLRADTLPWLSNIRHSLFAGTDTSNLTIRILRGIYNSEWTSDILGFHPDLPGFFIVQLNFEEVSEGPDSVWKSVIVTSDTGRTWQWLIPPVRFLGIEKYSTDPKSGIVYLSINATNIPEEHDKAYMLLRVVPWSVNVKSKIPIRDSSRAWPNPVNHMLHVITESTLSAETRVDFVDYLGRLARTDVAYQLDSIGNILHIDVSSIASGCYFIRIRDRERAITIRVVIVH